MPAPYDGGCLCGLMRYRVSDEPLTLYVCHCTDCQRRTGSAFALSMVVLKSALELLQGDPRTYTVTSSGVQRRGKFCADCSTRLWGEPLKFPQVVVVQPGTLDDTTWLRPIGHIWTRSKQPWVSIPNDTLNFEGQPDDPMIMVKAWQDRAAREHPARG
jgi:hypothetical protein